MEALVREVRGLHLDDSQWLELLEARTDGEALELVKGNRIVTIEDSPEYALKKTRDQLQERFSTNDRPSKQLLKELQQGPAVSITDASKLYMFAQSCGNIADFYQSNPTSLSILNEESTQNLIIKRLDQDLSIEWFKYKGENYSKNEYFYVSIMDSC